MTDLHTKRAAEIFDVPVEQVTPEQRRYAKLVNYAYAYSAPYAMGATLQTQLAIAKAKVKR